MTSLNCSRCGWEHNPAFKCFGDIPASTARTASADDELLDIISDAIDESMDVDWTSRDGARHVLGALRIGGYIRTAAMDALIADSADIIDAPASADAMGEVERIAKALAKADGQDVDEAESWLEAVAAWKAAGKPREPKT